MQGKVFKIICLKHVVVCQCKVAPAFTAGQLTCDVPPAMYVHLETLLVDLVKLLCEQVQQLQMEISQLSKDYVQSKKQVQFPRL